ncbi:hypothetical protein [Nesterenkonia rhizosphaerae]|uniref:Uncharacterized protein n=1 Tax=Nesterenkonia rhizosphaerae TaxID=1348272 RepID=A0ABP9FV61_9MICC
MSGGEKPETQRVGFSELINRSRRERRGQHTDEDTTQEYDPTAIQAVTEGPQQYPDEELHDDAPEGMADVSVPEHVKPPRANRTILLVAVASVISLVAGFLLSLMVVSPAQRAAEAAPPQAGPITVPVEERQLATDLTLRGDAQYDDPVSVSLDGGDGGGPAVVTGHVPEVGQELSPGDVLIEITGRPVIVLPGELPAYRSLRIGSAGPDVVQLRSALLELGYAAGHTASDVYDYDLSLAVEALYSNAGYAPPEPEEGAREMLNAAREELRSAQQTLTIAQTDYERADSDDRTIELAARDAAAAAAQDANAAVDRAWLETLTPLPLDELVYVDSLPRRVDSVSVSRGDTVSGDAITISGAELQILASVAAADAALISEDMQALLSVGDQEISASVAEVRRRTSGSDDGEGAGTGSSGGDRMEVVLVPEELSEEQRAQLVGTNVRVTIPMESTGGEVMVVPVAAVTAGPGGESRVEVLGEGDETDVVRVTTGLTAEGYVEITAQDLAPGDLVVVGR